MTTRRQPFSRELLGQILRFAVVGGLGFLIDAAVLQGLIRFGAHPLLARLISLAGSVTLTWRLNRALTFAASGPSSWREFGHYLATSLVALVVNYGLYSIALWLRAPVLGALIVGTAGGAAFNFIRYREIFAARETPDGGS